jgi:hypothetical protein
MKQYWKTWIHRPGYKYGKKVECLIYIFTQFLCVTVVVISEHLLQFRLLQERDTISTLPFSDFFIIPIQSLINLKTVYLMCIQKILILSPTFGSMERLITVQNQSTLHLFYKIHVCTVLPKRISTVLYHFFTKMKNGILMWFAEYNRKCCWKGKKIKTLTSDCFNRMNNILVNYKTFCEETNWKPLFVLMIHVGYLYLKILRFWDFPIFLCHLLLFILSWYLIQFFTLFTESKFDFAPLNAFKFRCSFLLYAVIRIINWVTCTVIHLPRKCV